MKYDILCSKIIKMDPKIRLASVFDNKSEKIVEVIQKNTAMHVPERITKEMAKQALVRWKSRITMKEWIGPAKFAMAEYAKVKRFTFYLNQSHLLLISTEVDIDNDFLIDNILQYCDIKR